MKELGPACSYDGKTLLPRNVYARPRILYVEPLGMNLSSPARLAI